MALADPTVRHGLLHGRRRVEKPQRIGDRRPRAAHAAGDLFLGQTELVDQAAEGSRLVHRVEVGSLQVLDQSQAQLLLLIRRPNERRDAGQAGQPCRAQAALTGNQLIAAFDGRHEDRLEQTVLADALGEVRESRFVELAPGLIGVGDHIVDRDLARALVLCHRRNECLETPSEPAIRSRVHGHDPLTQAAVPPVPALMAGCGPRAINSAASCSYACAPRDAGL